MKRTIVLIACGARKRATPCEARELYQGALFKAARRAAERSGHPWAILSALHGVMDPAKVLEPYDRSLASLPKSGREEWCRSTGTALRIKWPGAKFICLAPSMYAGALAGLDADFPLRGLGIGKQIQTHNRITNTTNL